KFLLLICRQHWPNLRQGTVDYGLRFLHRLLMNGDDLRFGCVKDRLNLGLLFGSQVQFVGEPAKAERVTVRASESGPSLRLGNDKTAQRDRTGGHNCYYVFFHSLVSFAFLEALFRAFERD